MSLGNILLDNKPLPIFSKVTIQVREKFFNRILRYLQSDSIKYFIFNGTIADMYISTNVWVLHKHWSKYPICMLLEDFDENEEK